MSNTDFVLIVLLLSLFYSMGSCHRRMEHTEIKDRIYQSEQRVIKEVREESKNAEQIAYLRPHPMDFSDPEVERALIDIYTKWFTNALQKSAEKWEGEKHPFFIDVPDPLSSFSPDTELYSFDYATGEATTVLWRDLTNGTVTAEAPNFNKYKSGVFAFTNRWEYIHRNPTGFGIAFNATDVRCYAPLAASNGVWRNELRGGEWVDIVEW